jgi:hypothetical protein
VDVPRCKYFQGKVGSWQSCGKILKNLIWPWGFYEKRSSDSTQEDGKPLGANSMERWSNIRLSVWKTAGCVSVRYVQGAQKSGLAERARGFAQNPEA